LKFLVIAAYASLLHFLSFGHNTLMDYYEDMKDSSKSHHPLITGEIGITKAHNLLHWGLIAIFITGILITIAISPAPLMGMIFLFLFSVFGQAYNDGLSKRSIFAFVPISACFTSLSLWAWFLSHSNLNFIGWVLIGYFFMVILFQISYSGCLKELEIKEESNLLIKLGARIEDGTFKGGFAASYGIFAKSINLALGVYLLWLSYSLMKTLWLLIVVAIASYLTYELVRTRKWNRDKTLLQMSLQEIAVLYLPIPLLLDPFTGIALMIFGVLYFFGMNKWLWSEVYPAV